jgi:hypothetical protein
LRGKLFPKEGKESCKGRAAKEVRVGLYERQASQNKAGTDGGWYADEFIMKNADPIWLHQNEMWELIPVEERSSDAKSDIESDAEQSEDIIPF